MRDQHNKLSYPTSVNANAEHKWLPYARKLLLEAADRAVRTDAKLRADGRARKASVDALLEGGEATNRVEVSNIRSPRRALALASTNSSTWTGTENMLSLAGNVLPVQFWLLVSTLSIIT